MRIRLTVLAFLTVLTAVLVTLPGGGVAGAAWSGPATLNTSAATDTGFDRFVELASDGAGNVVAIWTSAEDLNDPTLGQIGTDWDILVARSTDTGATCTATETAGLPAGYTKDESACATIALELLHHHQHQHRHLQRHQGLRPRPPRLPRPRRHHLPHLHIRLRHRRR